MKTSSITYWIPAFIFIFIAFMIDGLIGIITFGFLFIVWLVMLAVIKLLNG